MGYVLEKTRGGGGVCVKSYHRRKDRFWDSSQGNARARVALHGTCTRSYSSLGMFFFLVDQVQFSIYTKKTINFEKTLTCYAEKRKRNPKKAIMVRSVRLKDIKAVCIVCRDHAEKNAPPSMIVLQDETPCLKPKRLICKFCHADTLRQGNREGKERSQNAGACFQSDNEYR